MEKLLNAWLTTPNHKTANKLVSYNNKHTMAACILNKDELMLLNEAIAYTKQTVAA